MMENLPAYTRQSLEAYAKRIYDLTEERDKARAEADRLREALQPFAKVESRDGAAYCPWCSMFADGCTCEFGQARTALDAEDREDGA